MPTFARLGEYVGLEAGDNRRIATEARLRVIHGAVEAPLVDVFLVPAADAGTNQGNAMPALDEFAYGDSSRS